MKLSESIAFARTMYTHPAKSLLAQWQDQAERLEDRVASVEQLWVRDMRDLKEVITARYQDISDLKDKVAELQRMNDNQFAQLEANDKTIKELQQDKNDSQARAENLNDKLRATKAELEGCRVAYKGKKEQVDGLRDQLRGCDQLIVALRQEGEHLRRSISESTAVAVNKRIAQLEAQSRNLEAALVKAETDVKERDEQIDRLKRMYDTDITARNADVRWLSKEREELKEKLESLQNCNSNQYASIKGYQERVRQLKEQLETEQAKVGPVRDVYKDSKLEVRLLNGGVVEVLEYPADNRTDPSRLRQTRELVDRRTKVARREVELTRGQRSASIVEYDQWNGTLTRYNNVPVRVN